MHVVMFSSGKGGVGKSTIAANVAYVLAARNKVLLVDFSAFDKTSSRMLAPGCQSRAGVYDLLMQFREAYGEAYEVETCEGVLKTLEVLPPGTLDERSVQRLEFSVLAKRVKNLMDILLPYFSIVVLDYPGRTINLDPLAQALIMHVDHLIIVFDPNTAALDEGAKLQNFVKKRYDPPPVVSVVLNMYDGGSYAVEGFRSPQGFYVEVPVDGVVKALGKTPKLQIIHKGVSERWTKAIYTIAQNILAVKMRVRHTTRLLI
ncbi:MAG: AAA family ATPase [Pyrobaculum arsenaticum]|uniref:ParA family protein n=1 Tax=Pyrobaculum arsenaticum TaxID=121277 RepID=UPI0022756FFF|nr:AAA family ATPase [Pyrobaculum arsenaticum]